MSDNNNNSNNKGSQVDGKNSKRKNLDQGGTRKITLMVVKETVK